MRRIASLLILGILSPFCALAAVYNVGSGPGSYPSIAAAMLSITADASGIPATETISVQVFGGTYSGLGSVPLIAQPLIVSAAAGTFPIISSGAAFGISVSGLAHLGIQGFRIQNFSQAGIFLENCPAALVNQNTLSNDSIEIWLKNSPQAVISSNSLSTAGTALLLQDSPGAAITHNASQGFGGGSYSSGFTLTNSASSLIMNNQVSGALNGINLIGCNAVTLSANTVVSRGGIQGISLDSSDGCWLLNNLVLGQSTGVKIQGSNNAALHNNSVWDHSIRGLRINSSAPLQLRNNIIQGDTALAMDAASQAGLDSQYNDLKGETYVALGNAIYADLSDWQGTGNDTLQSISSDPLFANASGNQAADFKLQGGSPVLGLGQNLAALFSTDYFDDLRPAAGAWDLGFHAPNSTPPSPSPSFTASPVVPTVTVTPSPSPTLTPSYSPTATVTVTVIGTKTSTVSPTPTLTVSPYPVKRDKLVSYPNPYNPSLGSPLNFVFDPSDEVTLKIYDIAGGFIIELPATNIQGSQGYAFWGGRDDGGRAVAPGLYFAIIRSPKGNRFTRFTIVY